MTSLVTYNQFLVSKSNTTQIKEILSSQEAEKIAPIACSGQGSKDLKIGKFWKKSSIWIQTTSKGWTRQSQPNYMYIESSVLHCRCPSIQCYCYYASEKENSTRKDRRWAQPEWGDMTKCGPVTYCTRHGSLSDPQARRLASSPTPHFFIVQTPHYTTHTIWTSREKLFQPNHIPHNGLCVCCIIGVLCWSGTKTGLSKGELFYNWHQGKCGVRQQGKVRSVGVALCIIHLLRIVSD